MPTPEQIRIMAVEHGRTKKRNNAVVALLSGALPAILFSLYTTISWQRFLLGLVIGLVWGNAFEYAYHRWILHWPQSSLGRGHLQHHATVGAPDEGEHVTLGRSPWHIALLFLSNGLGVIALDLFFRVQLTPGIFCGWATYLIAAEEIHWRIHVGEALPPGFSFARAYHMSHHDIPTARYNVFLPLFDYLLGNSQLPNPRMPVSSR